jgi:hypothetical protein
MKTRTTLAFLSILFVGAALSLAAEVDQTPFMGTWKLNEAKSNFGPGANKNTTVVYSASSDGMIKVTSDGTDKDGKPTHSEWNGKFDGKDYPVTGAADSDSRSYTSSGKHSLSMTVKKGGKTTVTGKITVSLDGKSRTVTTTGSEPSMNNNAVYDKQ